MKSEFNLMQILGETKLWLSGYGWFKMLSKFIQFDFGLGLT